MKKVFSVLKQYCGLGIVLCLGLSALAWSENAPQTAPLDTIRESYADGSLSRLYTVRTGTGVREGVALSYHPNGKVAVEAPYKNGKLDGTFKSYFENGTLWQTISYKDGVEDGISTTYFENGTRKSREIYRKGVLDGVTEEWDDQGRIRRKLPYMRGHIHGTAKVFDDLGGLKEEMTFEQGVRHGVYRRYNKGIVVQEAFFEQNRCVKGCDF